MHIQVGHILIDRRRHSSLPDVLYFRRADYNKYQYLAAAKDRERLAVSKQATYVSDMEKFHLKKIKVLKRMGLNLKKVRCFRNLKLCYEHQQSLGNS
jgi:hypothetical protein